MSTFGLVHGHWHGAWCWDRLIPELESRGHRAVAMDLPCETRDAGCACNAQVVKAAIADCGEDIVLVGHSAGGLTIPLVAQARPVRRLIFIAALLPQPGRSLAAQFETDTEIIHPEFSYIVDGDGLCSIDPALASRYFYNDCTAADAAWATARLRRQTTTTITEITPLASWPDVPCSYLVTGQDRVIGTGWQRRAARERITADVVEFADSGHSPFLSRPGEFADVLARMADSGTA
jgi:pimeloyl-ACP methyl ester carboxylesterase